MPQEAAVGCKSRQKTVIFAAFLRHFGPFGTDLKSCGAIGTSAYCCSAVSRSSIAKPAPFLGVSSLNLAAPRSGLFFTLLFAPRIAWTSCPRHARLFLHSA